MKQLALSLALLLSACALSTPAQTLPPVEPGIVEIRVYSEGNCERQAGRSAGLCRTINDPATIEAIVEFVNARPDGWRTPITGASIHPIKIEFVRDGAVDRYIGVSRVSLERANFLSRWASDAEIAEISRLAGLEPTWFDFGRRE